jgi:hypothetical protein
MMYMASSIGVFQVYGDERTTNLDKCVPSIAMAHFETPLRWLNASLLHWARVLAAKEGIQRRGGREF